jgi:DNA-binding LytR/AlgR family response regulator
VQAVLAQRASGGGGSAIDAAIDQLRQLLGSGGPAAPAAPASAVAPLTVIQAGVGNAIHLVPVADVLYFEAADKYVRVVTLEREYLVRIALRELLPQIDLQRFWQIHRGTVVRSDAIATALRDEAGKVTLTLRGHADRLAVSRLSAHRFKPM